MKDHCSALIHVDIQNGFSENCPKELPVEGATSLVDNLKESLNKKNHIVKILTKDTHPEDAKYFGSENLVPIDFLDEADVTWVPHCVHGTYGFKILDGMDESVYHYIIYKGIENDMHPYGACYRDLHCKKSTGLIEILKSLDVYKVYLCGIALDYCVCETARQLLDNGFNVVIIDDACVGIRENSKQYVEEELKKYINDNKLSIKKLSEV